MTDPIPQDLQPMWRQCAEDPCDLDFDNSVVQTLIERLAHLTADLAAAKAGWDSCIADLREAAEICRGVEQERDAANLRVEGLEALMELACADIIFFHSQEDGPFVGPDVPELPAKVAFSVMVNDLFVPAADAEGFDISEAIPLRDVFRKDGYEGVIRWVQHKRDGMSLRPHVEKRIKEKENLRSENAALTTRLEGLIRDNQASAAEVVELRQEIATQQSHLENGEQMYIAMRNRCGRDELEIESLKARVEQLSGPVSDEEWEAHSVAGNSLVRGIDRTSFRSIIRARSERSSQ